VPEQTESLQEVRERELRSCHPLLHVHYNKPDSHLGLTLCRLLQAGKIVAIQGDRVVMDVAPVIVQRGGLSFRLPLGPLVLAEMTRVPCYPIFLHRTGRLRYQVDIFPAFHGQGERLSQTEIAQRWLSVMHPFVKQHWDQWFVFEHLVTR
jgi:predicted LPLAT superfamily acyltransferase